MKIDVACHAGYRGEETPRRLSFGDRVVDVTEVVDAWLAPDCRYFKLHGDDDAVYIVRHDTATNGWEMTMFDKTGGLQ